MHNHGRCSVYIEGTCANWYGSILFAVCVFGLLASLYFVLSFFVRGRPSKPFSIRYIDVWLLPVVMLALYLGLIPRLLGADDARGVQLLGALDVLRQIVLVLGSTLIILVRCLHWRIVTHPHRRAQKEQDARK